jgi:osmotically-inducible protein OsmY
MYAEKLDEKIREEILLELRWMPGVERGTVGVGVEAGVVTLTGHVADASARQAAEQLARRVRGVRSVADQIQIQIRRLGTDGHHEASLVRAVAEAFGRGHRGLN